MTPKQRDALVDLQRRIDLLWRYQQRLSKQARCLDDLFEDQSMACNGDFTPTEIDTLVCLNQRLASLEAYLREVGERERARLNARVAEPNDPLDDYEIEARLHFMLHEDDSAFDEDDDNFLTQRNIYLKNDETLVDGRDHREQPARFPGHLNTVPHCWLFHDLYNHSYGLEQPALSLQDCLRMGRIWVDIAMHHQATLDLETGIWPPAERGD